MEVLFGYFSLYSNGLWFSEDHIQTPQETCLKRSDYFLILWTTPHSIVNEIESWTHVSNLEINSHALPMTRIASREVHFQHDWCPCFLLDVLSKHKFHCINLWSRSWTTWKTNRITTTCFTPNEATSLRLEKIVHNTTIPQQRPWPDLNLRSWQAGCERLWYEGSQIWLSTNI